MSSNEFTMRFKADDTEDSDNYSMSALMKHSKEQLMEYYAIGRLLPANEYYQLTGMDVARMAYELLEAREKLAEYEMGIKKKMTNHSLHLTQIIASVWGDPADITDAVWQAGYRKPERGEKEIAELVIDVMNGVPDEVPYSERPRNLEDILTTELYTIIFEGALSVMATPAMVAKMILWNGYRKGGE
ncbi:hypothetical protein [Xenorhabdus thuongxuanensis]|uniref:Uncharacterized protein n=1 Tax=Xenorhabdus thuongxuanensis TaxID=1873484 RepID=A0A1Q5U5M6_9GAMM|nr:hypothetical protein [Xenorhabdus thuongxuanensis]OKP07785.1 hypothetical protein Xentx_01179 [Xenorhabdus thuongxuanensis]